MSVNGNFKIYFPSFGDPITSGKLNLLIGDLSFSASHRKATSVFFFFYFEPCQVIFLKLGLNVVNLDWKVFF